MVSLVHLLSLFQFYGAIFTVITPVLHRTVKKKINVYVNRNQHLTAKQDK